MENAIRASPRDELASGDHQLLRKTVRLTSFLRTQGRSTARETDTSSKSFLCVSHARGCNRERHRVADASAGRRRKLATERGGIVGRSSLCSSVLPRLSRLVWLLTVRCIVRVLHRGLVARVGLHRGLAQGFILWKVRSVLHVSSFLRRGSA